MCTCVVHIVYTLCITLLILEVAPAKLVAITPKNTITKYTKYTITRPHPLPSVSGSQFKYVPAPLEPQSQFTYCLLRSWLTCSWNSCRCSQSLLVVDFPQEFGKCSVEISKPLSTGKSPVSISNTLPVLFRSIPCNYMIWR